MSDDNLFKQVTYYESGYGDVFKDEYDRVVETPDIFYAVDVMDRTELIIVGSYHDVRDHGCTTTELRYKVYNRETLEELSFYTENTNRESSKLFGIRGATKYDVR